MPNPSHSARSRTHRRRTLFAGKSKLWILLLVAAIATAWGFTVPREAEPLSYDYQVDLANSDWGEVGIVLTITGRAPDSLELEFAGGLLGGNQGGPVFTMVKACQTDGYHNGARPVSYEANETSITVHPTVDYPLELTYTIQLKADNILDEDLSNHLSVQTRNSIRAAGFSIFLIPVNGEANNISVTFSGHQTDALLAPWPTLPEAPDIEPAASTVPGSTTYYPGDMRDLFNSFIACGDLRLTTIDIGPCTFQLATDTNWLFDDRDVTGLARRIAHAEVEFFGSVPQPVITCLLTENRVSASSGFDTFGIHTGCSILLMLDPATSYTNLKEHGASILAHEMFHGWLGEAIRQEEPDMLWFTEGATTLYSARLLAAAGIWSETEARDRLNLRYRYDYFDNPAREHYSIAVAAADVLGDTDTIRLAYAGGALACEQLDSWLASRTGHEHPLDDVLRELYATCDQGPLTRIKLTTTVQTVTGWDCRNWLTRFVYGNQTLPQTEPMI